MRYYIFLVLGLNVVLGNLLLLFAPVGMVRFNYTWGLIGLPTTIYALVILLLSFKLIKAQTPRYKLFLLALVGAALVPVGGVFFYFMQGVASLGDILKLLPMSVVFGLLMFPLALPFVFINFWGFCRFKKAMVEG